MPFKNLRKRILLRKYNVKIWFKLKYAEVSKVYNIHGFCNGIQIKVPGKAIYVQNFPTIDSKGEVDTVIIRGKTYIGI